MLRYVKLYLITLVAFFAIDLVWLVLVAQRFYSAQIGFLMAPQPNWPVAILFYLLFIFGILFFVVVPGLKEKTFGPTLIRAALFGLITYATYDLTNLATLKDWPAIVTVVDLIWGTTISVGVSAVSLFAGRRLR